MAGHILNRNSGATATAAFAVGVVAGLFLKEALQRLQELTRRRQLHHDREGTVTYGDNLPDPLERREPAPHPGQPRFGGTGALGVPPAVAATSAVDEPQAPGTRRP